MTTRADLVGEIFGILLVVEKTHPLKNEGVVTWECACACGGHRTVRTAHLRNNTITSCGCSTSERRKIAEAEQKVRTRTRTEKICGSCKQLLPLIAFHKNKGAADRHASMCKACTKIYNKLNYKKQTEPQAIAARLALLMRLQQPTYKKLYVERMQVWRETARNHPEKKARRRKYISTLRAKDPERFRQRVVAAGRRSRAKNYNTIRARDLKETEQLTDSYIKSNLLHFRKAIQIPHELIEAKRLQVLIQRTIHEKL